MLHVIVIRKDGEKIAHGHIAAEDTHSHVFCGDSVPQVVLDMWNDPRNPYQNKGTVTCIGCLSEWKAGRTIGWLGDTSSNPGNQSSEDGPPTL